MSEKKKPAGKGKVTFTLFEDCHAGIHLNCKGRTVIDGEVLVCTYPHHPKDRRRKK